MDPYNNEAVIFRRLAYLRFERIEGIWTIYHRETIWTVYVAGLLYVESWRCPAGFERCTNSSQCIRNYHFCDGINNCVVGTDEDTAFCGQLYRWQLTSFIIKVIVIIIMVVFVGGKPGTSPLTGSDLPSHWFVWKLRGMERGRGGKGEREGWGRPPALLPPPHWLLPQIPPCLPPSTLSSSPDKSVALARRTLWRLDQGRI